MAQIPTVLIEELPSDALLLDVREHDEWSAGHIDGALHIPMNEVPNKVAYEPETLTPEQPVYVVCKAGGRSAQVTAWLTGHGYTAFNVDGGMLAWATAKRPMVSDGAEPPFVL